MALANEVSHLFALGLEIAFVGGFRGNLGGDTLGNLDPRMFEGFDLGGVIGNQAHGVDAELLENLRRELKFAAVGFEAELEVGFDRVETLVLKLIGAKLGHEADATALLLFIEEDAGARIRDQGKGEFKLLTAVASQGVKDIAGEALRVNSDKRRSAMNVAHDESDSTFDATRGSGQVVVAGLRVVDDAFEAENPEVPPASGEVGVGHLVYGSKRHLFLIIRFGTHRDWIRW
jgi:hypothetical protein